MSEVNIYKMGEFKCVDGCGICCGLVPIPKATFEANKDKIQRKIIGMEETETEVYPMTESILCCFLTEDKRCSIYDSRPDICIRYGLDPMLQCPYIKMNGRPRSPALVRRMQRQINHFVDDSMKRIEKVAKK